MFLIDGSHSLKTACSRHGCDFRYAKHGNRNSVERVFREVKRPTPSFSKLLQQRRSRDSRIVASIIRLRMESAYLNATQQLDAEKETDEQSAPPRIPVANCSIRQYHDAGRAGDPPRTGRPSRDTSRGVALGPRRTGGGGPRRSTGRRTLRGRGRPRRARGALAEGLLRENVDCHTLQHFEAAVNGVDCARTPPDRRLALVATVGYLSVFFPTSREREQTFDIACRLHRGEALHEE